MFACIHWISGTALRAIKSAQDLAEQACRRIQILSKVHDPHAEIVDHAAESTLHCNQFFSFIVHTDQGYVCRWLASAPTYNPDNGMSQLVCQPSFDCLIMPSRADNKILPSVPYLQPLPYQRARRRVLRPFSLPDQDLDNGVPYTTALVSQRLA